VILEKSALVSCHRHVNILSDLQVGTRLGLIERDNVHVVTDVRSSSRSDAMVLRERVGTFHVVAQCLAPFLHESLLLNARNTPN
jgi:hypothetical protein